MNLHEFFPFFNLSMLVGQYSCSLKAVPRFWYRLLSLKWEIIRNIWDIMETMLCKIPRIHLEEFFKGFQ